MSHGRRQGRGQQAFEDLLDPAYLDEDLLASNGGRKAAVKQASRKKEAKAKLPGFRFKDSPAPAGGRNGPGEPAEGELQKLMDIFGGGIDAATVSQTLRSSGSVEAAAAALSEMLVSPPARLSVPITDPAVQVTEADLEVCGWGSLPLELKEIIWGQCSLAQLARVAITCREFCAHLRTLRSTLKTLTVPPGLSRRTLVGMVAAFGGATRVTAVKCKGEFSHQQHWLDFFQAVQAGSTERKLRGSQPVSCLDLHASQSLRDDDALNLLTIIDTLQELDVSRCGISDRFLLALSDYQATFLPEDGAQNGSPLGEDPPPLPGDAALPSQVENGDDRVYSRQRSTIEAGFSGLAHQKSRQAVASHDRHRRQGRGFQVLNLSGCPNITNKGIKALLTQGQTGKSLQTLNVSGCPGMDLASLDLGRTSSLRILKAQRCHRLSKLVIAVQEGQLLQELDLSGCSQLARVEVRAARLRDLNLSGCGRLRDTHRPACVVVAPGLTRLLLAQCHQVSGEELGPFPKLQELNLHGCREVRDTAFQTLVQPATALRRLIACGCSLKTLSLEGFDSLEEVDVGGCSRLEAVTVRGRVFSKFSAKHCPALLDVEVHSPKLQTLDFLNCSQLRSLRTSSPASSKERHARLCVCGCDIALVLQGWENSKLCRCRGG